MLLTGYQAADGIAELLTMLLVFVLVLILAWYTTRWIARYQRGQKKEGNISILETCPAGNGKFIQIVRVADTYFALAVCKDTVTLLGEIPKEQLTLPAGEQKQGLPFQEWLRKAGAGYRGGSRSKKDEEAGQPEDSTSKEE